MPNITRAGRLLADPMVRRYAAGFMGVRPLRIREKVQCGVERAQASLRVHRTLDPATLGANKRPRSQLSIRNGTLYNGKPQLACRGKEFVRMGEGHNGCGIAIAVLTELNEPLGEPKTF